MHLTHALASGASGALCNRLKSLATELSLRFIVTIRNFGRVVLLLQPKKSRDLTSQTRLKIKVEEYFKLPELSKKLYKMTSILKKLAQKYQQRSKLN
jgi:hypothetical protein